MCFLSCLFMTVGYASKLRLKWIHLVSLDLEDHLGDSSKWSGY